MAEKHIIGYHKEDNPNCKCDNGVTYFNCGKKCECCALHPAGTGVAGKTIHPSDGSGKLRFYRFCVHPNTGREDVRRLFEKAANHRISSVFWI